MKKKTYADLFKPVEEQPSVLGVSEGSSGLSTPLGSELGSSRTSGSEDEEFMAELSRQMAECMLLEEDNNTDSTSLSEGFEAYRLKQQPQESGTGERRVKGNRRVSNTGRNYVNYRQNGQGIGGSGMKAIFLDNSGSSYGSGGTGVFLPRSPKDSAPEKKKKSACSTVLIPVRVLQTLELHFSRLSDSSSSVSRRASPRHAPRTHSALEDTKNGLLSLQNEDPRFQNHLAHEEEEMHLPQEWTY